MSNAANPLPANSERLELVIREWAENLWDATRRPKLKSQNYKISAQARDAFNALWFPTINQPRQGLTRLQAASETSFTFVGLGVLGATRPFGNAGYKAVDKLFDMKLIEAWRRSIQRTRFQPKYTAFETLLKEALARPDGEKAARKAFNDVDIITYMDGVGAAEVLAALSESKYKSTLPRGTLEKLLAPAA